MTTAFTVFNGVCRDLYQIMLIIDGMVKRERETKLGGKGHQPRIDICHGRKDLLPCLLLFLEVSLEF